jgi:hypothetical protein
MKTLTCDNCNEKITGCYYVRNINTFDHLDLLVTVE